MSDAYSEFGLLLATVWGSTDAVEMVTSPATIDAAGQPVLFGADGHGHRHVMAPIPDTYAVTPQVGDAIELRDWTDHRSGRRYLDLACLSDPLAHVFAALADNIVERVETQGTAPHSAILGALDDWRRLLRPARSVSEEAARGLFGELTVLSWLAAINSHYAVDRWTGPDSDIHDFMTPQGDLEVKTSSREGQSITVSSLTQLDDIGGSPLVVVRIQAETTPAGKNISELVDQLVLQGCLRAAIVEKLERAGFLLGIDPDNYRFVTSSEPVAWLVTPLFPGLRSSDLPHERRSAITRVSYTLDLVGAEGLLSKSSLDEHLVRMMTQ